MRSRVSEVEWDARVRLAACYRLMAHTGVVDLTYNHLSARIPDAPDRYLIKGEDMFFEEVTASSLLAYDFASEKVYVGTPGSVSRGGLVIHGGVMEARPDLMAVFHTHTPANMGMSAHRVGMQNLNQHSVRFHGQIGYHEFGGFEFDLAGRERLIRDLEGKRICVLANHGMLACGRSIAEAYITHHFLEMSALSQVAAFTIGDIDEINVIPEALSLKSAGQSAGHRDENGRDWAALMRLAERLDPSFRD